MEKKDISKRTVLVLLILTLVISVVGTWTILSQPASVTKTTVINPAQGGKVSVNILDGAQTPAVGNAGGKVSLNILK